MPVIFAPTNVTLKIVRILTDEKTKKRLESLGVTVNGEMTLLSSDGGAAVCRIKDGTMAFDSELSTKIFVVEA